MAQADSAHYSAWGRKFGNLAPSEKHVQSHVSVTSALEGRIQEDPEFTGQPV